MPTWMDLSFDLKHKIHSLAWRKHWDVNFQDFKKELKEKLEMTLFLHTFVREGGSLRRVAIYTNENMQYSIIEQDAHDPYYTTICHYGVRYRSGDALLRKLREMNLRPSCVECALLKIQHREHFT